VEPAKKPGEKPRERPGHRRSSSRRGQWAINLTIFGTLLLFVGVILLVTNTGSRRPPEVKLRHSGLEEIAPKREEKRLPEPAPPPDEEPEKKEKGHTRPKGPLYGKALREQIDKAFEAAKERVGDYAKESRWLEGIARFDALQAQFDDDELRLRCQPEIDKLRRAANQAYNAKRAEADKLAEAGRYDEARKLLEELIKTFNREEYTDPARERIKEITQREDAEAAADFARKTALINEKLPTWEFEDILAEATKLQFTKPQYKEQHARRVERLRALAALKKKVIRILENASPRLDKRALHVPGWPGEISGADDKFVYAATNHGAEKIPWPKLFEEGSARLALLAGSKDDPNHRLAVARLLMEVGYTKRARKELEAAKDLGANIAADEAELAAREKAGEKKDDAGKKEPSGADDPSKR